MKINKKEQKKIDDWNKKYSVGQKVIVKKDDGKEIETVTKCKVTLLGGHTAVGWFRDITGCYSLNRVRAIK